MKGLEVTFLIELRHLVRYAVGQKLRAHDHERPVIAGAMIDQRLHELHCHKRGVSGLRKRVPQQLQQFLTRRGLSHQPCADSRCKWYKLFLPQQL